MKDDYLKMFFWRAGGRKEMVQRVAVRGYDPKLSISIIECRSALDGYEVAKDYIFGQGEYMAPHLDGRVELTTFFYLPKVHIDCRLEVAITFAASPNHCPLERCLVPLKLECGSQDSNIHILKLGKGLENLDWDFFYEEIVDTAKRFFKRN